MVSEVVSKAHLVLLGQLCLVYNSILACSKKII